MFIDGQLSYHGDYTGTCQQVLPAFKVSWTIIKRYICTTLVQ